jgi:hypothetical protein
VPNLKGYYPENEAYEKMDVIVDSIMSIMDALFTSQDNKGKACILAFIMVKENWTDKAIQMTLDKFIRNNTVNYWQPAMLLNIYKENSEFKYEID